MKKKKGIKKETSPLLKGITAGALLGTGVGTAALLRRNSHLVKGLVNNKTRPELLRNMEKAYGEHGTLAGLGKSAAKSIGVAASLGAGGGLGYSVVKGHTRKGKAVKGFRRKNNRKKKQKPSAVKKALITAGVLGTGALAIGLAHKRITVPNSSALATRSNSVNNSYKSFLNLINIKRNKPKSIQQLRQRYFSNPTQAIDSSFAEEYFVESINAVQKHNLRVAKNLAAKKQGGFNFDIDPPDFGFLNRNPANTYRKKIGDITKHPDLKLTEAGFIDHKNAKLKIFQKLSPNARAFLLDKDEVPGFSGGLNPLYSELYDAYIAQGDKSSKLTEGLNKIKSLSLASTVGGKTGSSNAAEAAAYRDKIEFYKNKYQINDIISDLKQDIGLNEYHLDKLGLLI